MLLKLFQRFLGFHIFIFYPETPHLMALIYFTILYVFVFVSTCDLAPFLPSFWASRLVLCDCLRGHILQQSPDYESNFLSVLKSNGYMFDAGDMLI